MYLSEGVVLWTLDSRSTRNGNSRLDFFGLIPEPFSIELESASKMVLAIGPADCSSATVKEMFGKISYWLKIQIASESGVQL